MIALLIFFKFGGYCDMALLNSTDVIGRAIDNFNSIKNALDYVGVDTASITSDEYGNSIRQFKSSLDKVEVLEEQIVLLDEQIDNLETTNSELSNEIENKDSDFADIYDAIVEKGQNPNKEDTGSYADAILSIETGGGGSGEDYEINNACHLFGYESGTSARANLIDTLLPHCKNVTNWKEAFIGCLIPNGSVLDIDMTSIKDDYLTGAFKYASPENANAEITIKVKSNGFFRYAFQFYNDIKKYGLTNIEIKNTGAPTDLSNCFESCQNVKSLVLDIDASNVQYMNWTFEYFNYYVKDGQLTVLDLSSIGLDGAKLASAQHCFENAKYIEEIKLPEGFVFSNCNLYWFAYLASNLKKINMDIVDSPNGATGNFYVRLFQDCINLEEIVYTQKWVTYNDMDAWFGNNKKLLAVPPVEMHVSNNRYKIDYCYYNCESLEEIELYTVYDAVTTMYLNNTFVNCKNLKIIKGNLDLSIVDFTSNPFAGCTSLERIETTGSLGGTRSLTTMTFDISASPVFDIAHLLNNVASNDSGKTRIIKLNATVYNGLTEEVTTLAATKNYTLASA